MLSCIRNTTKFLVFSRKYVVPVNIGHLLLNSILQNRKVQKKVLMEKLTQQLLSAQKCFHVQNTTKFLFFEKVLVEKLTQQLLSAQMLSCIRNTTKFLVSGRKCFVPVNNSTQSCKIGKFTKNAYGKTYATTIFCPKVLSCIRNTTKFLVSGGSISFQSILETLNSALYILNPEPQPISRNSSLECRPAFCLFQQPLLNFLGHVTYAKAFELPRLWL